jgi:hypothetical protein
MADPPAVTAGARVSWVRRAAVSAGWAVLVVALLSRVNRPLSWEPVEGPHGVLQRRFARVDLDLSSLDAAVGSISRSTGVSVRVDQKTLEQYRQSPRDFHFPGRVAALSDVSLESVLNGVLLLFDLGYRVEGETIVFEPPAYRTHHARAVVRVYDVRDLAAIRRAWDSFIAADGAITDQGTVEETLADVAAGMAPPYTAGGKAGFNAQSWGARVVLLDTPEGHRRFANLLFILRAGDSGSARRDLSMAIDVRR